MDTGRRDRRRVAGGMVQAHAHRHRRAVRGPAGGVRGVGRRGDDRERRVAAVRGVRLVDGRADRERDPPSGPRARTGMEFLDAALTVLREESPRALHWTVIQDLALQRGYLDPFTQRDIRKHLLVALADAVRRGAIVKASTGVYRSAGD